MNISVRKRLRGGSVPTASHKDFHRKKMKSKCITTDFCTADCREPAS